MSNNRDLGIQGSPGKGDTDRTTDVKKFQDNLAEIPLNPSDKTGFKEVSKGRYRKTYGRPKAEASRAEPSLAPATPTPASLMLASRAKRSALGGSSDH